MQGYVQYKCRNRVAAEDGADYISRGDEKPW